MWGFITKTSMTTANGAWQRIQSPPLSFLSHAISMLQYQWLSTDFFFIHFHFRPPTIQSSVHLYCNVTLFQNHSTHGSTARPFGLFSAVLCLRGFIPQNSIADDSSAGYNPHSVDRTVSVHIFCHMSVTAQPILWKLAASCVESPIFVSWAKTAYPIACTIIYLSQSMEMVYNTRWKRWCV